MGLSEDSGDICRIFQKKYKENNFEFQIVELASENQLLEKEQEYLNEIKNTQID